MKSFFKPLLFTFFIMLWLPLTHSQSVEQFTLDNGLNILIKPDHRAPVAVVMVWYRVGSSDEPGGLTGISHALEHMMFKGTPTTPAGKFSQTIAKLGGQDNAFTHYDYTAYFEKISTTALPKALELEADRMEHLLLSEAEFSKEIKVVQEERRLRTDNNPQALTMERFLATAHLIPPYQHPIIGWMSDLTRLTVQELRNWYASFYAPNNATLIIIGDVTPTTIMPLIHQDFDHIKKRAQITRYVQTEPPSLGEKTVNIEVPAQQPLLLLGFAVPGLKQANRVADAYALEALAGILDAGNNARLTHSLIQTKRLAIAANAFYDLYSRYPSEFILSLIPTPQHSLDELKQALLQEIQLLQTTLVAPQELMRIKTQLIAHKTFEKDTLFGQAMEMGVLESIGLSYEVGEQYTKNLQAVTPEQVREVAQRYFQTNNLTTAQLIPTRHTNENH